MSGSLTTKTLHAAKWTYLSTAVTAGLQIVVTAVLARLLTPDAFGLVAMSALVLRFGQYFAQMGVGQAIVQRAEVSDAHKAAGFWASVVVGIAFSGAAWLLSPVAASLFDAPELNPVLQTMGLSFFITGTSTTSFALLRRAMRFKAIACTEIVAYVIAYSGALVLAATGAGVWALVFAGLCQTAISSISYNLLARPVVVPVMRWQPYRELLGFGTTVSFISFLEFLNANLDTMAVGRLGGATQLGFYNRALSLTGLPMYYMSTSLSKVLLPSFSRIQKDARRTGRAYISLVTVFAGVGFPVALGMSAASSEIVAVLLGADWTASVSVMRIVAVASVMAMMSHFGGILLEATAHLREKVMLRMIQLAVFVLLIMALGQYGLTGYALALALSAFWHLFTQSFVLCRVMAMRALTVAGAYVPGLVGGSCAGALLWGESMLGERLHSPDVSTLILQVVSGAAVLVASIVFVRRGQVYRTLRERFDMPTVAWAAKLVCRADRITGLEKSPRSSVGVAK